MIYYQYKEINEDNDLQIGKLIHESLSDSNSYGCIINNMPVDSLHKFKQIVNKIGKSVIENYPGISCEDGYIHDVAIVDQGLKDTTGKYINSTTAADFACHTDGSNMPNPYDLVMLLSVQPDVTGGGKSVLCNVEKIINELSIEDIELLLRVNKSSFAINRNQDV